MSAISVRRTAISQRAHKMHMNECQEDASPRKRWLRLTDVLAFFGAVLVIVLVKSGALGAIPF